LLAAPTPKDSRCKHALALVDGIDTDVTVVLVGDDAMAMKDALPGTLRIQTRTMRELDGILATHLYEYVPRHRFVVGPMSGHGILSRRIAGAGRMLR
jgi:hypothetical protein